MIAKVEYVEVGNEKLCNVCNKKDYGYFATINGISVCERCSRELHNKLNIFISRRNRDSSQWGFFE